MVRPKKPKAEGSGSLLTEAELEMMTILWRLERATVNAVLAELPAERQLAYTSVSTILRILEQKGVVVAEKEGRGHVYVPAISRDDYGSRSVGHLVAKVFDGEAPSLVKCLVEKGDLSPADLDAMREILAKLEDRG